MRASSLPLLLKCPGSLILPQDDSKSANAQDGADWGTMVHHWAQTGEIRGRSKRSESAFRKALAIVGPDRAMMWPAGGNHEQAIAVRVDGTMEASRDDTPREGWITGHYDYQYWLLEDELWVDDLKTGKFYPNPMPGLPGWVEGIEVGENRYPQDVLSPQIKTYALGVSLLLGYTGRVTVSVTHWPRLPLERRHSPPQRVWHTWEHEHLIEHWHALVQLYLAKQHNEAAVAGKHSGDLPGDNKLILFPGDHCRFCPSRNHCFVAQEF